ncbi:MAG: YgiQ family radical SAM protein [Oscillospiraceae bacterium]|nr:YgiQ family radical SAM protein [Oscillospiraceae bacterium]
MPDISPVYSREMFLPVSKDDMTSRGMWWYDFLVVSGDAYVDHPTFGPAVIARYLEHLGYRVAFLAQPDWKTCDDFLAMGKPKLGVLIGAGNLDSMVAHYTAAKKPRSEDYYSPGKKAGLRPDRASIVYANRAREAFPDTPIIIGGLEASLRRFAHYDYWDDKVRHSVLLDSGADLLVYGMGERPIAEIAALLKKKTPISEITKVNGTAYIAKTSEGLPENTVTLPSFDDVKNDKKQYAIAARLEFEEHDAIRGRTLVQSHGDKKLLVCNPPALPLNSKELDLISELPYTHWYHPMYDDVGGVPAIEEVRFSVSYNRGCFGGCSFCALAMHQGRMVTARSSDSVVKEVKLMTTFPDFKGYINDVGGPTADFGHYSCKKQEKHGMCRDRNCLTPEPCPNLDPDHSGLVNLYRRLRSIEGIKKIFIRSGVRYDYMLEDKSDDYFRELCKYHVSGQLRVAPEHCVDSVLAYMGKPSIGVYEKFLDKYYRLSDKYGKEQYAVPYLMSSHPGSTLEDAIKLAEYLNSKHRQPEQVQDFYPTPGTLSTAMYYSELDPFTLKPIFVAKTYEEKKLQRALLQWKRPDNRPFVIKALKRCGREDLIGFGPNCLVRPDYSPKKKTAASKKPEEKKEEPEKKNKKPEYKAGWAKPKAKKNARPVKSGAKGGRKK